MTDRPQPTVCNSFRDGVVRLANTRRDFPNVGTPSSARKVVSRGEEISQKSCSGSVGAKNRKLNFMVNLNEETP